MGLNLTGSQFGDFGIGHSSQNAGSIMNTDLRAVMFVFKPYNNQFEDVALRPFNYRFDTNFINDVERVSDSAARLDLSQSALISDMKNKLNFNDCVIPTPTPQLTFKASHLSYNYRFILILTEDSRGLILPNTTFNTSGNNKLRRIYTGYFTDEPFTYSAFGTKKELNPHAAMVITHKTVVGMIRTSDQWGGQDKLATHISDEIFNPTASKSLTSVNVGGVDGGIHWMTPDNCLNGVDMTDEGDTFVSPNMYSNIDQYKSNTATSSILEQPDHNVTHVVRGMIKYIDEQNNRNIMLGRSTSASFDDRYVNDEIARGSFRNKLQMPRSNMNTIFDLDINASISPVDIDRLVDGNLEVELINLERPDFYDTADQFVTGMQNQFSFLISSVVIPVISGAGLDSLQFTFEIANFRGQIETNWGIANPMPNYPVSNETLGNMIRAVQFELENGIFKTIFDTVGAFGVTVSACCSGMTSVRLNLVDQGMMAPADFEFPSCLGGLVSPLIGDTVSQSHNSQEIESLFSVSLGGSRTPSYFNDDDKDFLKLAQERSYMNPSNAFKFDD